MQGERFGILTVLSVFQRDGKPQGVLVKCDCGTIKETCSRSVRRGRTRSCGCLQKKSATSHGLSRHPEYGRWNAMVQRCENKNWINYDSYGGRGISVCREWRGDPSAFFRWLEESGGAAGKDVDRINNDLGYSPDNCRIVTRSANARNTRSSKVITVFGEKITVAEAAERFDVPYDRLSQRLNRLGWDAERAVSTPTKRRAAQ